MANQPQQQTGGASLSDLLTVAKNIATAINALVQAYKNIQGLTNFTSIAAPTVIKPSSGRICVVSVISKGTAEGGVFDSAVTGGATNRPLWVIPMVEGVYVVNLPASFGITIIPGTGQSVSGSYS